MFQALQVAIVVILLLSSLFRPVILYLSANCWPAPNMIMISFRAFIVNLIRDPPSSLILSCVLRGTPFDRPTPDSGSFPLLRLEDFNGSCQHSEDTVVSSCLAISTLDSLQGKDGLRSLSGRTGDRGRGGGQTTCPLKGQSLFWCFRSWMNYQMKPATVNDCDEDEKSSTYAVLIVEWCYKVLQIHG